MEVDKKLGMSLDDLIKKTRSDKPKKAGGAKKGNKPAKKAGKLGIRKSLNKKGKANKDTDVKMVTAGKKKDGPKKRGALVSKKRRVVRRVSTGGAAAAGSRRQDEKKFSRKVVVKAGPNAPADNRRKIKIQNVPYDLSWKDIKEALSQVGKIERCDVEHGEATLIFSSNKEALRAIQTYNGGDMNGRKIRVFFV
jgi:hypothetical protein